MKSIILALVGVTVMSSAAVAQDVHHETVVHKTVVVNRHHPVYHHPRHVVRHKVVHRTVVTHVNAR